MKNTWSWAKENWLRVLFYGLSTLFIVFLSIYNLESITSSRISMEEVGALHSSNTVSEIVANPLYAPFKAAEYITIQFAQGSIYLYRLVPALFGILGIGLFYFLARYWFSPLIAWLSTIMFATSTLYLHHARLALASIFVPILILGLLWATWYMSKTKNSNLSLVVFALIFAIGLYIPGVIWFALLAVAIQRRHIITGIKNSSWIFLTLGFLLAVIFLAPLFRAFYLNTALITDWLAIPSSLNVQELVKNFVRVPLSLTVQSKPNPEFNLGRLPIIDVLTLALMVLGSYAYIIRFKLMRTRTLIAAALVSWALLTFGKTDYAVLLPLIYLLAAGGIMFLLQQWYSVFPRNPIARSLGLALLVIVVGISIFYNIQRYFVAWPHNPATVETFSQSVPPNLVQ